MEDACASSLGETEHIDRSHHRGLHRLDGIELVVNGGGGAGEVINLIDFELYGVDHIVAEELEQWVIEEVADVLDSASEEVV